VTTTRAHALTPCPNTPETRPSESNRPASAAAAPPPPLTSWPPSPKRPHPHSRSSAAVNPTDEQHTAADAFEDGQHLALQAGAGTGKTTTLALLAHTTQRRGRYLAYNRAIAQDAATRFPRNVQCKTAHSMAYAAIGHRYAQRLNAPRRPAWQTGHALGITKPTRIGERDLSQKALSYATLRTVSRFCHTADDAITPRHVPRLRGLEDHNLHNQLAAHIVPFARSLDRPPTTRRRRSPLRPRSLPEDLGPHAAEDRHRLLPPGRGPGHQPRRRTRLPRPTRPRPAGHGR
jgi:hypothetical protein